MNIYWTFDTHRQEKRTLIIEGEKSIQKGKFCAKYEILLLSTANGRFYGRMCSAFAASSFCLV